MEAALHVSAFIVGAFIVQAVLRSAIRTVVVPRGEQTLITRKTFLLLRAVYELFGRFQRTTNDRERTLARYAPMALLSLAAFWAAGTIVGFVFLYWSVGAHDLRQCMYLSGSSITTLGVTQPKGGPESALAFSEAFIGLGIVALLISYLPTIYQLFSRREAEVVKLDVRAGSPPTALEMLTRYHRIGWIAELDDTWAGWETWFAELEESHSSYPALVFFRSQRPGSSWITCAGAVLDTASISLAAIDAPRGPQAAVMLRAGFMALRTIAGFYGVPLDDHPDPHEPISIYREEFMLLFDELGKVGLPMREDKEQAWRDFAGWRVNYDAALVALCALVGAPPTPWSADRVHRYHRPTFAHPKWRIDPPDTPPSW